MKITSLCVPTDTRAEAKDIGPKARSASVASARP